MARKATVHKIDLEVADIDRGYYASHRLTLARHPSETEARLMVRVLAFAMHADPRLEFGRGISSDDEPDLWLRDDAGVIDGWIDVGLPDARRIRRAIGRSRWSSVIAYGQRATAVWWDRLAETSSLQPTLSVWALTDADVDAMAELAARRTLSLQCTLQEGQIGLGDGTNYVEVLPQRLQVAAGSA